MPNLNYGKWVANTPSNTETFGVTYQDRHLELGIFNKRVGAMWNDLSLASKTVANQIVPIAPFSLTNVYLNYTLGGNSVFAESTLRFSATNRFDNHNIVNNTQAANSFTIQTAAYQPGAADILQFAPSSQLHRYIYYGPKPAAITESMNAMRARRPLEV